MIGFIEYRKYLLIFILSFTYINTSVSFTKAEYEWIDNKRNRK